MPTKRELLIRMAQVGGISAAFLGMQALGLTPAEAGEADLQLAPAGGNGTRVVILGGGIGGLVCAWELGKAGYDCTVLEARGRVGGRNWSIRGGDRIELLDGSVQDCRFDPGLYWNAGPARLPSIHKRIHGYCKEMGVKLEVEINTTRAARLYNPQIDRPAIEMRQAVNDTRGAISELLSKAIDRGALDQEIAPRDRERVFAFLQQYGDLTPEKLYKGSNRSGWAVEPGVGDLTGSGRAPLPLSALLDYDLWNGVIYEDIIDQQATMFQPVGGMDHIPKAFEARLGAIVQKNCEVLEIRRAGSGVHVAYLDRASGNKKAIAADYCISTLPLVILNKIPADFSPRVQQVIRSINYHESVKIAWQSRRFWEQDFAIYGGLSWVKGITNMVWYPSGDLFADQGILIGAYASQEIGDALAAKTLQQQFDLSRAMVEGLHPGYGRELGKPMAIAWKKMPFALGAAPLVGADQGAEIDLLGRPDGPFYFTGDYLSHIGNWQEASLSSAHRTMTLLDQNRRARVQGESYHAFDALPWWAAYIEFFNVDIDRMTAQMVGPNGGCSASDCWRIDDWADLVALIDCFDLAIGLDGQPMSPRSRTPFMCISFRCNSTPAGASGPAPTQGSLGIGPQR